MTIESAIEATMRRVLDERLRPIEDAIRRFGSTSSDELLTVDQAAALTGYSARTLRSRAKAGTLPGFKPKGSSEWRFRRGELLAAMAGRAAVDIEAEARKIATGG